MKPMRMTLPDSFLYKGREDEKVGKIEDLEVVEGTDGAIYSAWRPSLMERIRIALGSPVVVGVLMPRQPPITLVVGLDKVPR